MKLLYNVEKDEIIKNILKNKLDISKRLIHKLKINNKILLNGEHTSVNNMAYIGDKLEVDIAFEEESNNIVATNIPIDIIYEDDFYIILNKSAKIETHPTCANYTHTLANGLKYYFEQNNIKRKIRPVNRLDKETSGLIVFAKNEYIQEQLVKQMKSGIFEKEYMAVVCGILKEKDGIINVPIKRKEGSILERCVAQDGDGDTAITEYTVLQEYNNFSLVNCKLKTGRTHQIRVHLKYIGHPIVSDFLYGERMDVIDRQALHSYKLQFIHPVTKEHVKYEIDLSEDIKKIVAKPLFL